MVGDEAQLYNALAPRLERIVRLHVRAPREVIEDACHQAWVKLINHSEQIDRSCALSWLTTTAVREAWKLDRRERRETSLDALSHELDIPPLANAIEHRADLRERLAELESLPARQRRLVWLQALGLSYREMAAYTGDSVRTVERQIRRATARMREIHAAHLASERDGARASTPPQATASPRHARGQARELFEGGIER